MEAKDKNSIAYFICHSFDDEGWHEPSLQTATYVHADLSKEPQNENFNEMSLVTWLDGRAWKEPAKKWAGIGHYRRWIDLDSIDKLDKSCAYIDNEPQPACPRAVWELYHSKEWLDRFLKQLRSYSAKLSKEFIEWLDSNETTALFPARNLVLLPKEDFCKLLDFQQHMMGICRWTMSDTASLDIWKDRYQKRQPGFMMERLTAFWLMRRSKLKLVPASKKELNVFSPYQRELRSCVVLVQKNEANLDEWARWHLDVCGFSKAIVFNNECEPHKFPAGLEDRILQAKVADMPNSPAQFRAYNFFLSHISKEFDLALFIDADEYLVLHGQTLEEWTWKNGPRPMRAFNWVYYGSKVLGEWPKDSLAKRFRHRSSLPDKHVKILLDLRILRSWNCMDELFFANPHCLHSSRGILPSYDVLGNVFSGPYCANRFSPAEHAYIAHFYCKTKEEFEEKIKRGRADCAKDSQEQYFTEKKLPEMWEEFKRCDQNEVFDDEISERMRHHETR